MSRGRAVVLGAGGHAKVVIATLQAAGWEVAGVFDDDDATWGSEILGLPVRGPLEAARDVDPDGAVVAVGRNRQRQAVAGRVELPWISVVHPSAVVHESVSLGQGTVVFAGVVIQPDTVVGAHAILNTGASVDHDCRLGDLVHAAPGSRLGGGVVAGNGALLGLGCSVLPGVTLGNWSVVGAGAAVVCDVPGETVIVGVPGRSRRAR